MGYEAIPFPTGQSSAQIYNWATATSAALRRILQEVSGGADDVDLATLASDVSDLQDETASLQEQIDAITDDKTPLTPQREAELDLVTASASVRNSVAEFFQRSQTANEKNAEATIKAAIAAHRASTGIRSEVTVREGLAQVLNSVMAALGVTGADLTELRQAIATGDAASAIYIQTAASQVASNIAQITVTQESVDGIKTHFGVELNSQGEVIGSIGLDGTPQGSGFTVNVDNFKVGKAGTTGGDAAAPFSIQTVDGSANMALKGNFVADGTITADKIAANAVTADKISANSLSAISANLGTVTAGLIQNTDETLKFDLPNMRLYRTDGKVDINLSAGTMLFQA